MKTNNNTPLVALFWFRCKCGQIVRKGETYTVQDDCPMCLKCGYPEPKERKLIPLNEYLKRAI